MRRNVISPATKENLVFKIFQLNERIKNQKKANRGNISTHEHVLPLYPIVRSSDCAFGRQLACLNMYLCICVRMRIACIYEHRASVNIFYLYIYAHLNQLRFIVYRRQSKRVNSFSILICVFFIRITSAKPSC